MIKRRCQKGISARARLMSSRSLGCKLPCHCCFSTTNSLQLQVHHG